MRRTRDLSIAATAALVGGLIAVVVAAPPAGAGTGTHAVTTAPATTTGPPTTPWGHSHWDYMCTVGWYVTDQTSTNFVAQLTVRNPHGLAIDWSLQWSFADGQTVTAVSSGTFSQSNNLVTITGAALAGMEQRTILVSGTWNGTQNSTPYTFRMTGSNGAVFPWVCSVNTGPPSSARPSVPVTTPAAATCAIDYEVLNSWPGGFLVRVTVINRGAPLSSWTVSWAFPNGQKIVELWGGDNRGSGSSAVVANAPWNGALGTNASAWFGFLASGDGPSSQPATATLNGVACEVV